MCGWSRAKWIDILANGGVVVDISGRLQLVKIVKHIVRVWLVGGRGQCGLGLVMFLVFANVDAEADDDNEGEHNDNAEDDDHDPVVTMATSQSCSGQFTTPVKLDHHRHTGAPGRNTSNSKSISFTLSKHFVMSRSRINL